MTRISLAVLAITVPAQAQQPPCGPSKDMDKVLSEKYQESPVGAGIVEGGLLYVTTNPETGTFTVLVKRPDGTTCILVGGKGYATTDAIMSGKDL